MTGTPTADRMPNLRTASAGAPDAVMRSSIRAGRCVWNTSVATFRPRRLHWVPTGKTAPKLLHTPMAVATRPGP